jgi:PAS domain S-box-containing protein
LVERVNPALVRQTGYPASDLVGSNYRQLMDRIQAPREIMVDLLAATDNSLPWQGEIVIIRADDSTYDAAVTVSPLLDDHWQGEEIATVVSLRDVSQIKEINRLKTQFLATAAHELRTPLTSIRGFSEILLKRDLSFERQKSYLEIINAQSVLLSDILNDLLDISRLESGRGMPLQLTAVNPVRVTKQVLKALKGSFPLHNFHLDGMRACPPVEADEMRLEQVILNLLSNAAKYSPEGGDIALSAQTSGKQVAIRVTDNGIGMTPEQQIRLFETFYRADEVVEMNIGGTGLGLAICKYIMDLMGGRIEVESEHGVGSTFSLWLPLAESGEKLTPRS